MRCSKCNGRSRVVDTGKKTAMSVYRRRQCKNCLHRWTTYEMHSTSITTGVVAEILRQDRKLGEQNHHPFKWICIIGEELGEVCRAALEDNLAQYRKELIETAVSCVTAIKSFDRQQEKIND